MDKHIEEKKLYNKIDLRNVLNKTPYLMWIKDGSGIYRFANNKFLEFFNLHKKDVLGKKDRNIFFLENKKIIIEDSWIINRKLYEKREEKIIINKKVKWIQYYMWPLYKSGEKKDWIAGIAEDITSSKLLEELLYDTSNIIDKQKFSIFLNSLMEQTKSLGAGIFLYDKDRKTVMLDESCGCCEKIEKHFSFVLSDAEYKKLAVGGDIRKFSDESEDVWIKKLRRFFNDTFSMMIYGLHDNTDIIGFFILIYNNISNDCICNNEFIEHLCEQTAYLYMKKNIMADMVSELDKREENERYMKLLLDTATDFYGVLNVDSSKKEFNVNRIYNSSVNKEEIVKLIENFEYDDKAGKINSSIRGRNIRDKIRIIKDKEREKFIEFRWYNEENGKVIITGKDKTIEKNLEDYNKELTQYIELEKMKSDFFANISHEFKTPLNIIITASQLIKIKDVKNSVEYNSQSLEKYLFVVKQNGYRLLRLINNLLDIRIIDKGYFHLELDNYNIVSVIKKIVWLMKGYLDTKNRYFYFETECEEIVLACDPEKIERILMNLISNAVKYTDEFDYIKVIIKKDILKKKVVITVENNGIQLDEDSVKIIFKTFTRADNMLSRRCEGSGIGLYIVKSLVELHNGDIWVDVSENNKTKFIFDLPIVYVNDGVENKNIKINSDKIERCNMEFSDIY